MNETPSEIRQYEQAVLTVDLPEEDLQAGDVATLVDIHEGGAGYSLEFFTLAGETIYRGDGDGREGSGRNREGPGSRKSLMRH